MNSETLRWYLYQLAMPTESLARLLGLHHDTIRHWVEGDRQPPKWIVYPLVMELWHLQYCRSADEATMFDANNTVSYRDGYRQGVAETMHHLRNHMDICNRVLKERI